MDTFDKIVVSVLILTAWALALIAIDKSDKLSERVNALEGHGSCEVSFEEIVIKGYHFNP